MDHNLLVSELQALIVETKRRYADVKDASEAALELLKGGVIPRDKLHEHADTLLDPITKGCKTKVAKVIGISIAALQRLVALGGVPTTKLPDVLQTLSSVANQAVDIQLKILQTLLSILTYNKDVHDEVLGNALLLCFKLQDSRVSVVSSTAAATLRQAVMLIFDRLSLPSSSDASTIPLNLPTDPVTELQISPSAYDAYNIFADLCLLTASAGSSGGLHLWGNSEKGLKPNLLKLHNLNKTFGLELIESILSGYEDSVKKQPELLFLLQHSLDPLLLKLLSEKPTFPIALRVCRLIFLLMKSFTDQLPEQVEVYLTTLIKMGMGEYESHDREGHHGWLRVLALEIIRGICGDTQLLQSIYSHYDSVENTPTKLYNKIVTSLSRLINEKPILLGIGTQMHGLGVPHTDPTSPGTNPHASYLDLGIGMVSSAATAGVNTMNAMMGGQGGGLSSASGVKLRLIEQHDKAEAPLVPETYIYLLALQSIDAIANGIYTSVATSPSPPEPIKAMASSAWPALLAALSYTMGTNLSDQLFAEVLTSLQDFTVACGLLELITPRDAFLSILGKYAVPPPVVSAMQSYMENPNPPRNPSVISADALGFSALGVGGPSGPPSLSERNLACLRSTVNTARVLGPSLGKAWHDVLEILQNANFLLAARKPSMGRRPTVPGGSPGNLMSPGTPRPAGEIPENKHDILQDLDPESIQLLMNALFDSSRDLPDGAFTTFVTALCQLSSEMIGMGASNPMLSDLSDYSAPPTPNMALSPSQDPQRRRTSGINISHSIKSGERSFSLTKLRVVSTINLNRIITQEPEVGWTVVTQHLLAVARHLTAPATIRIQASDTLGELLLAAVRIGKEDRIQHQVFDVLVKQVDVHPVSNTISTDYEVRSAGYQTLNQILESSGHSLSVGWSTIFGMLDAIYQDRDQEGITAPSSTSNPPETLISPYSEIRRPSMMLSKGNANLVRIAFPSLQLICTDFLSSLDLEAMKGCITCLGHFSQQVEDVNITLAAVGLLWTVSDAVQTQVQDDSRELWLYLLTELLALSRDGRMEVRNSALQTLFRCIELYGSGLSSNLWRSVFEQIIYPLMVSTEGDESSILALTSIGKIFGNFLVQIQELETFEEIYQKFLDRVKRAWEVEPRNCATAGMKALERVLTSLKSGDNDDSLEKRGLIVENTWKTFLDIGQNCSESDHSYTQDNLIHLVKVGSLLHDQLPLSSESSTKLTELSNILRTIMTYTKSTDYRPDTDTLSPLQSAIASLISDSNKFSTSQKLNDLAEFTSLAYFSAGEPSGTGVRVTYVGLTKRSMYGMVDVLEANRSMGKGKGKEKEKEVFEDGTIENVLGAYSIPIKLKYDCPPANKFGNDPPLWKTAMTTLVSALDIIIVTLDEKEISEERFQAIWSQIIEIFNGMLLADSSEDVSSDDETFVIFYLNHLRSIILPRLGVPRIPNHTVVQLSEALRKASILYHYDVRVNGGTTAPGIPESQEELRYWALELLVSLSTKKENDEAKQRRVAGLVVPALMKRFGESLNRWLEDKKLRGNLPFGRVREEEILFVLRHLATMQVYEGSMTVDHEGSKTLSAIYKTSTRSHLFHFYKMLLQFSFLPHTPSMWIFPSEHSLLFGLPLRGREDSQIRNDDGQEINEDEERVNAGDGGDLIEVSAGELARRCLELIGEEMGLGT
ncbi:hypothetical protein I302_102922 [Kwoniella bestiolae CBS 10118]|uniref:Protein MON2 n=1 Tax=Kwoniella bestiolae CBS 10118 TaxID=1296100 RepID=A0A1B9GGD3_9TREE|nr:hypothetical protein I302_01618 [Kwoniella bestiolae CBS 10118]OCF30099.1 hypothetical protein I302_01618 [Kwoniella bestiolae CBS 10118]